MEFQDKTHTVLLQHASTILAQKQRKLISITPDLLVYDAVALMADNDIGALPVLENGRLAGMISERDYARKIILEGRSSRTTRVAEIMSIGDLTVPPDATIGACMELMTGRRTRHLLVIEAGELKGIISIGDLVNAIMAAQDTMIGHLSGYIASAYPQ